MDDRHKTRLNYAVLGSERLVADQVAGLACALPAAVHLEAFIAYTFPLGTSTSWRSRGGVLVLEGVRVRAEALSCSCAILRCAAGDPGR